MNTIISRISPHLALGTLLLSLLIPFYLLFPGAWQPLDNQLQDLLLRDRGLRPPGGEVVIVAVDEPSLQALGQWPWERHKIARILANLDRAGALVIGIDIIFAEADRTSPGAIAARFGLSAERLPDYDAILAETIAATPVVLGYALTMNQQQDTAVVDHLLGSVGVTPGWQAEEQWFHTASGAVTNLPMLQQAAISAGFLNYLPTASGDIRQLPLLLEYKGALYPSIALELYRLLQGGEIPKIDHQPSGITAIDIGARRIATDNRGLLHLNYHGPGHTFPYLSAAAIYSGRFDPEEVAGRTVLIGATATGLVDLRPTPFDKAMPGVEIHATALQNLLDGRELQRPDWLTGAEVVTMVTFGLLLALLYPFLPAWLMVAVVAGCVWLFYTVAQMVLLEQRLVVNLLFPLLLLIGMTTSSALLNLYIESCRRKMIRANFARKVSATVVEDILKHGGSERLIGHRGEVTIFFSDVRNFTTLCEEIADPERVIALLNLYMTPMVDSVIDSQGTVDKMIGDAIMAYWNAPNRVTDHADSAVTTALEQLRLLPQVNRLLQQQFGVTIDIGIGIHSGEVIVGEMGSSGRSDYTIIGDAVNLASRVEGMCKRYGARIIITEETRERLQRSYPLRELDRIQVKGKQQPVTIYQVLEAPPAAAEAEAYGQALSCYQQGAFQEAQERFQQIQEQRPEPLYQLYLERCQELLQYPPTHFDGVYQYRSK
ncbi:MAG: adenylate/guanylate cyclase domain-containing protein [Gammaproteobacteria bacterium]|nr:adenylate/guanylate cyclase domain-containing protein [Gammaproteobacteria bacterium]